MEDDIVVIEETDLALGTKKLQKMKNTHDFTFRFRDGNYVNFHKIVLICSNYFATLLKFNATHATECFLDESVATYEAIQFIINLRYGSQKTEFKDMNGVSMYDVYKSASYLDDTEIKTNVAAAALKIKRTNDFLIEVFCASFELNQNTTDAEITKLCATEFRKRNMLASLTQCGKYLAWASELDEKELLRLGSVLEKEK